MTVSYYSKEPNYLYFYLDYLFMSKSEQIPIIRHIPIAELNKQIKNMERDTKILNRLYFIKFRYEGESVEQAANRVNMTKMVGYIWQERWNEESYEGLVPKYAGGRPSKLSDEQKERLIEKLKSRNNWTTDEVQDLIHREFGVDYTLKQVRVILKHFGMRFAKPFLHDYRKPEDAKELLKKN